MPVPVIKQPLITSPKYKVLRGTRKALTNNESPSRNQGHNNHINASPSKPNGLPPEPHLDPESYLDKDQSLHWILNHPIMRPCRADLVKFSDLMETEQHNFQQRRVETSSTTSRWPCTDPELASLWESFVEEEYRISKRPKFHLVIPSGTLSGLLHLRLHYPSFNAKSSQYGQTFDPSGFTFRELARKVGDIKNVSILIDDASPRREGVKEVRSKRWTSLPEDYRDKEYIKTVKSFTQKVSAAQDKKVMVLFGRANHDTFLYESSKRGFQYKARLMGNLDLSAPATQLLGRAYCLYSGKDIHRVVLFAAHPEWITRYPLSYRDVLLQDMILNTAFALSHSPYQPSFQWADKFSRSLLKRVVHTSAFKAACRVICQGMLNHKPTGTEGCPMELRDFASSNDFRWADRVINFLVDKSSKSTEPARNLKFDAFIPSKPNPLLHCAVAGCSGRPNWAGLCTKHQILKNRGRCGLQGSGYEIPGTGNRCYIAGCGAKAFRDGLCWGHSKLPTMCKIPGCEAPKRKNCLCAKHFDMVNSENRCGVVDCRRQGRRNGLCRPHWIELHPDQLYDQLCKRVGCKRERRKDDLCGPHWRQAHPGQCMYGICKFDDCEKERKKHGYCPPHWKIANPGKFFYTLCKIEDCTTIAKVDGLCKKHKNEEIASQTPTADSQSEDVDPTPPYQCMFDGCIKTRLREGFCREHWEEVHPDQLYEKRCAYDDCPKARSVDGLCVEHWKLTHPNEQYVPPCIFYGCESEGTRRKDGLCRLHWEESHPGGFFYTRCKIEDCETFPRKGGLCIKHQKEQISDQASTADSTAEDLNKLVMAPGQDKVTGQCKFPECDKKSQHSGLCSRHFHEANPGKHRKPRCKVSECDKGTDTQGLCRRHWREANPGQPCGRLCKFLDCKKEASTERAKQGYCCRHYTQVRKEQEDSGQVSPSMEGAEGVKRQMELEQSEEGGGGKRRKLEESAQASPSMEGAEGVKRQMELESSEEGGGGKRRRLEGSAQVALLINSSQPVQTQGIIRGIPFRTKPL